MILRPLAKYSGAYNFLVVFGVLLRTRYRSSSTVVDPGAEDGVDEQFVVLLHLDHPGSHSIALLYRFLELRGLRIVHFPTAMCQGTKLQN